MLKKNGTRAKARPLTDEEIERDRLGPLFEDMANYIFEIVQRRRRAENALGVELAAAIQTIMSSVWDPSNMTPERCHTMAKAILVLLKHASVPKPHLSKDWLWLADNLTAVRRAAVAGVLVRSPITRHRFSTRGWFDSSPVELFNWIARSSWFQTQTRLNQRLNYFSERFLSQANERMQREWGELETFWPGLRMKPPRFQIPQLLTPEILEKLQRTVEILSATPGNFDEKDDVEHLKNKPESTYAVFVGVQNGKIPPARERLRNFYASLIAQTKNKKDSIPITNNMMAIFRNMMVSRIMRRMEYKTNEEKRLKKMNAQNWQDTPYENYKTPDIAYGVEGWRKHVLRMTAYMNASAMEYSAIPKPQAAWKRHLSVVADTVTFFGVAAHVGAYVLDQRALTTQHMFNVVWKERREQNEENLANARVNQILFELDRMNDPRRENPFFKDSFNNRKQTHEMFKTIGTYLKEFKLTEVPGDLQENFKMEGYISDGTELAIPPTKNIPDAYLSETWKKLLSDGKSIIISDGGVINHVILPPTPINDSDMIRYGGVSTTNLIMQAQTLSNEVYLKYAEYMESRSKIARTDISFLEAWNNVASEVIITTGGFWGFLDPIRQSVQAVLADWSKYILDSSIKYLLFELLSGIKSLLGTNIISLIHAVVNTATLRQSMEEIIDGSVLSVVGIIGAMWNTFYFFQTRGLGVVGSVVMVVLQSFILLAMEEFHYAMLVSLGAATGVYLAEKFFWWGYSFYKPTKNTTSGKAPKNDTSKKVFGWFETIGGWIGTMSAFVFRKIGLQEFANEIEDIINVGIHGLASSFGVFSYVTCLYRYITRIMKMSPAVVEMMKYASSSYVFLGGAAVTGISLGAVYRFQNATIQKYAKMVDVRPVIGSILRERPDLGLAGVQLVLVFATLATTVYEDGSLVMEKILDASAGMTPVDRMFGFLGLLVATHLPWYNLTTPSQIAEIVGVPADAVNNMNYPLFSCSGISEAQCEIVRTVVNHALINKYISSWAGGQDFIAFALVKKLRSVLLSSPDDFKDVFS